MIDVFLHIPKTGGTSLRRGLRWVYAGRNIYSTPSQIRDPKAIAEEVEETSAVALVRGHIQYGLHEHVSEEVRYFTMMRDPVKRVISLFYYIKLWNDDKSVSSISLAEYIESGHSSYVRNDQAKRIAGVGERTHLSEAETLEKAKVNLFQHITAFGLTERYDESLVLLRNKLAWAKSPFYIRGKTNRERPSIRNISPDIIHKIEKQNAIDIELYGYAKERFGGQILEINIREEVKRFKAINKVYSTIGYPFLKGYAALRRMTGYRE